LMAGRCVSSVRWGGSCGGDVGVAVECGNSRRWSPGVRWFGSDGWLGPGGRRFRPCWNGRLPLLTSVYIGPSGRELQGCGSGDGDGSDGGTHHNSDFGRLGSR
jgi:hypothetical protein